MKILYSIIATNRLNKYHSRYKNIPVLYRNIYHHKFSFFFVLVLKVLGAKLFIFRLSANTVISEFIENQSWNNNFVGVVIEFYVLWDLSAKIKVTI